MLQISLPRLSYLPLLLPRLHAFFSPLLIGDPEGIAPETGYFTYDSVLLKWHLPVGLLYDIYVVSTDEHDQSKQSLPFRLTLQFSSNTAGMQLDLIKARPDNLYDAFINSVKEADFLRSGTAKPIMSLSAADSMSLWVSAQESDLTKFARIHSSLLPPTGQMRNIPLRVYLPSSPEEGSSKAQIKSLQSHISPFTTPATSGASTTQARTPSSVTPQTMGTALHLLIPSLFPSKRTPILARPILHGVAIPLSAHLEDLVRWACYADGWLCIVVLMNN